LPRRLRRSRRDECAELRITCDELRQAAEAAARIAAQAVAEAEEAHVFYTAALRTAAEARQAHATLADEAAQLAAQVAELDKGPTNQAQQQLEKETTHAAFAAYRRGDISSEQLREVFRRAEGWTPEHDRISRRSMELRAEEVEALRSREAAEQAEAAAAERARLAAVSANALNDEAHAAADEARVACAAVVDCEQRGRRR
jgi:hypothetical protein